MIFKFNNIIAKSTRYRVYFVVHVWRFPLNKPAVLLGIQILLTSLRRPNLQATLKETFACRIDSTLVSNASQLASPVDYSN